MASAESSHHEALAHHQCLVRGLVIWVMLLSLTQVFTLAIFFTLDPLRKDAPDLPLPCPTCTRAENDSREFIVDYRKEGSSKEKEEISWISLDGSQPTVHQDGLYFLYIKVTLQSSAVNSTYTIRVKKSNNQNALIEGTFAKKRNEASTTGFLGRQVQLRARDELKVTCFPAALVNTSAVTTFMGIYLLKPI